MSCVTTLSIAIYLMYVGQSFSAFDSQLYSRQMFTYGRSAQEKIMGSHIAVIGRGKIYDEVAKNLALAGVGKLTLVDPESTAYNPQSYNSQIDVTTMFSDVQFPSINYNYQVQRVKTFSALVKCDAVVCTGMTLKEMSTINRHCREQDIKCIGSSVCGVCGLVFSDFGPHFKIDVDDRSRRNDEIPVSLLRRRYDKDIIEVTVEEGERHNCGVGDSVSITIQRMGGGEFPPDIVNGTVLEVLSVSGILVELPRVESDRGSALTAAADGVSTRRVLGVTTLKKLSLASTRVVNHQPLAELLATPKFTPMNSCAQSAHDTEMSHVLLAAFLAAEEVPGDNITALSSAEWCELVCKHLRNMRYKMCSSRPFRIHVDVLSRLQQTFIKRSIGRSRKHHWVECPATATVVGGIASQEAIYAVSGGHLPLNQLLLVESLDSLPDHAHTTAHSSGDFSDVHMLYGDDIANQLKNLRVLVAGVGAIGCELLKNFANLNIAEGGAGNVDVVDPDSVERSNLNRQLLFREGDIGKGKAISAAAAVRSILGRDMRVRPYNMSLARDTEDTFTPAWWEDVDVVMMGLDNTESRQYVDSCGVRYTKPVVDSGTSGLRGHVQVILPGLTESYSSSSDPPDQSIPICSIKSFPYKPEHCVAWARSLFDEYFVSDIVSSREAVTTLVQSIGPLSDKPMSPQEMAKRCAAIIKHADKNLMAFVDKLLHPAYILEESVKWAVRLFDQLFYSDLKTLIAQYPLGMLDEEADNAFFWSSSLRRYPRRIERFNRTDPMHLAFVTLATQLRGQVYGCTLSSNSIAAYLNSFNCNSTLDSSRSVEEYLFRFFHSSSSERNDTTLSFFVDGLISYNNKFHPIPFEKDSPTSGHVDFCLSAARLRCRVFGMRDVSHSEVHQLAGNIIPAVVTSTAVVGGLATIELIKIAKEMSRGLVKGKHVRYPEMSIDKFRNHYVDLSRAAFAYTEPVPAETMEVSTLTEGINSQETLGHIPKQFTLWDFVQIEKCVRDVSLGEITSFVSTAINAKVVSVSCGDLLVYADFLPGQEETLSSSIRRVILTAEEAVEAPEGDNKRLRHLSHLAGHRKYVDLVVYCEDDNGQEVPLPPFRVPLERPSRIHSRFSKNQRSSEYISRFSRAWKILTRKG